MSVSTVQPPAPGPAPASDEASRPETRRERRKRERLEEQESTIPVELYGGPKNDIPGPPAGETYSTVILKFFTKQFGIK